jgi:hypothetical protein
LQVRNELNRPANSGLRENPLINPHAAPRQQAWRHAVASASCTPVALQYYRGKSFNVWGRMRRLPLFISLLAICSSTGCAPAYDSVADQLQSGVEKKIDEGLIRLATDARIVSMAATGPALASSKQVQDARTDAAFASNIKFYADVESDLSTLASRLQATGISGQKEAADVNAIEQNVEAIGALHEKQDSLSVSYLSLMRTTIDQQFKPLDVYQVQLKGGGKGS